MGSNFVSLPAQPAEHHPVVVVVDRQVFVLVMQVSVQHVEVTSLKFPDFGLIFKHDPFGRQHHDVVDEEQHCLVHTLFWIPRINGP